MSQERQQAFSRYSRQAAALLGKLIRRRRIEQAMTVQVLAERAGVSRGLVQRIERGDMGCSIGAVFEVAAIVGVPLFDASLAGLSANLAETEQVLRLLPRSVHSGRSEVPDDF